MYLLGNFQLTSDKFIIHERPGHFTNFNKFTWDVINLSFYFRKRTAGPRDAATQKPANCTQYLRVRI
jgi:hypothetical protein